jgi:type I restriction enzyme S subunit
MELKPGYKQTEVGAIPEDWDALQLNAVCTMKSGEGITASSIDNFSEYPCYGGNGLRGYTRRFTHDGSFALIGRQGALCGNVVSAQGKFFASEHAVVVTPRTGYDIGYLTFVLGEMHLNQYSESSAQPGLSVSKLLKLPLAVPRAEVEQHIIAMALRSVDALLGELENLITKKRDIKQAAMQELLTGKRRLPGFEGEEWEVKRLGDLCSMKSGEGITAKSIDTFSPFPCYGGNGLRGFTSRFTHDGDYCLIGRVGALCGNLLKVTGQFFASEHAIVVSAVENVDVTWLTLSLGTLKLNRRAESSAQPVLTVSKLEQIEVNVPSAKKEQTAIATILSEMDAELAALEAGRDKTHGLKQGMMQELLTGRTRLT